MSNTVLGIDVAKSKLDVALMLNGKPLMKKLDNNIKGFKLLQGWLASLKIEQVHACLEATGPYGDAVAEFLHQHGHRVSVVNPLQIKSFAKSDLQRNKTDQADARTIAAFCLAKDPRDWHPLPPEIKQLQAMMRRIEALERMLLVETNRLEMAPDATRSSIARMIENLKEEIDNVKSLIKDHIDNHPDLRQQSELCADHPGHWGEDRSAAARRDRVPLIHVGPISRGTCRRHPQTVPVGHNAQLDQVIKTRHRPNQKSFVFSGDQRP